MSLVPASPPCWIPPLLNRKVTSMHCRYLCPTQRGSFSKLVSSHVSSNFFLLPYVIFYVEKNATWGWFGIVCHIGFKFWSCDFVAILLVKQPLATILPTGDGTCCYGNVCPPRTLRRPKSTDWWQTHLKLEGWSWQMMPPSSPHISDIMEMTWKHSRLKTIPPVSTVAKVFVG